jgi:hypothetical protein
MNIVYKTSLKEFKFRMQPVCQVIVSLQVPRLFVFSQAVVLSRRFRPHGDRVV